MKVTYNWLKDFVNIKIAPEELARRLTMAGLEVTSLEKYGTDYVFEIEITSNRPDWLSVMGIAREVAAITKSKVKSQKSKLQIKTQNYQKGNSFIKINIEDGKDCPLYTARVIRDVKVGHSPDWLAKRLESIGVRPVNNIVDITNYMLFVTGQPMHAFDLDKIISHKARFYGCRQFTSHKLKIIVRRAIKGEKIVTLDGIERFLNEDALIISLGSRESRTENREPNIPIAIAGIMGGKDTEVTGATRDILLESAYFSPAVIRQASRKLALSSDSSYRFERSVDLYQVGEASVKATALILELCGGRAENILKSGTVKKTKKEVILNLENVERLLGSAISPIKIRSIFTALGFNVAMVGKVSLRVTPPSFRQDISQEVDLLEEVSRIYGYENFPVTHPAIKTQSLESDGIFALRGKAGNILSALGFNEVINYSLLSKDCLEKSGLFSESAASLQNPLSLDQEFLRPSLATGFLLNLSRTLEKENRRFLFFETGDVFSKDGERTVLGLAGCKVSFLEFKGIVELLLEKLAVKSRCELLSCHCEVSPEADEAISFLESPVILKLSDKSVGFFGGIKKEILVRFKIDSSDVFFAELDLGLLKEGISGVSKKYQPVPKYPSLFYDLSLVIAESVIYQQVVDEIKAINLEHLRAVNFKDIYRSPDLGIEKKSVTISLEFNSPERTLTDHEGKSCLSAVILHLGKNLQASIR